MRTLRRLIRGKALCLLGAAITSTMLFAAEVQRFPITSQSARGDGATMNTKAIQATIDQCAAAGGGTVVIPKGEFLTGALFLKPGVNLELSEGAVLKGSKAITDFPVLKNERFEGHFQDHVASLLNVVKCDHFHLSGPGVIDGNGEAYWSLKSPDGRPRLCMVRDSAHVVVSGVRFMSSPSWNLHLYHCQDSVVENCRFEIPDSGKGPSTDGTDIDSCENTVVQGCYYSVNDDCICLKGNRYDGLNQEPTSPPVKNVHVLNCTFVRGMGALTLGTEATLIQDVEMEHCTVRGNMPMFRVKFRPDTPGQDYRNIHVHDISLDGRGTVLSFEPFHGTKVAVPTRPISQITQIVVENITGHYGSFGKITGGTTAQVTAITLRNLNVTVSKDASMNADGVIGLTLEGVVINDVPLSAIPPFTPPPGPKTAHP
jgi:polygalacturonase